MDTNPGLVRSWLALVFLLIVGLSAIPAASNAQAAGAKIAHFYGLNGSFADAMGGSPLVPAGGTLGAMDYSFGPNQGLALGGGLLDPAHYSIETVFRFNNTTGFNKIIDFKDLTVQPGLYNDSGQLDFQPPLGGPFGVLVSGVDAHVVLTRDGGTKEVIGYVDSVQQFAILDTADHAVFTGPSNVIHFFKDDSGGTEATAGVVDRIAVYQGVLSQQQVTDLFAGGPFPPPAVPGVSTLGLGLTAGLLLVVSLWTSRRRRQQAGA